MKGYRYLIFAIGFILLLLPISAAGCGQTTTKPGNVSSDGAIPNPIPKAYADFEVGPLTVTRSAVSVGELATVSTTIKNTGDIQGSYTAALIVDGKQADQKVVAIGPDSSESVSFQISESAPGSYKLEIADSSATLNVYQWPYRIQYDQGIAAYGELLSLAGDYGANVRFTPPAVPFKIQKIELYTSGLVAKDSEWYDNFVTIRIWDSSKTQQLWTANFIYRDFWNDVGTFWKEIDVPNVAADGDFYVEVVTHGPQLQGEMATWPWGFEVRPAIFIAYAQPDPYQTITVSQAETRSGISVNGQLVDIPVKYKGINWMIRVVGDGSL